MCPLAAAPSVVEIILSFDSGSIKACTCQELHNGSKGYACVTVLCVHVL